MASAACPGKFGVSRAGTNVVDGMDEEQEAMMDEVLDLLQQDRAVQTDEGPQHNRVTSAWNAVATRMQMADADVPGDISDLDDDDTGDDRNETALDAQQARAANLPVIRLAPMNIAPSDWPNPRFTPRDWVPFDEVYTKVVGRTRKTPAAGPAPPRASVGAEKESDRASTESPLDREIRDACDRFMESDPSASDQTRGTKRSRAVYEESDTATDADDQELRTRYARDLEDMGLSYEELGDKCCPLCTFANRTNDAVSASALKTIEQMINRGSMNAPPESLAIAVAVRWNKHIYRPMMTRGKRILPLRYHMAYEHITQPHRPNPTLELLADKAELDRHLLVLRNMVYYNDAVTGHMTSDNNNFKQLMKVLEEKRKLRQQPPERMAFAQAVRDADTLATVAASINPFQHVVYTQRGDARKKQRSAGGDPPPQSGGRGRGRRR